MSCPRPAQHSTGVCACLHVTGLFFRVLPRASSWPLRLRREYLYQVRPDLDPSRAIVDAYDDDDYHDISGTPSASLLLKDQNCLTVQEEVMKQEMEAQEFGFLNSSDYQPRGSRKRSHSTHENDGTLLAPLLQSIQPLFPLSSASSDNEDENWDDLASAQDTKSHNLQQLEAGTRFDYHDDYQRSSNSLDTE